MKNLTIEWCVQQLKSIRRLLGGINTNSFVKRAGDTMEGSLVLAGDPSSNLEAATKQYVDAANESETLTFKFTSQATWMAEHFKNKYPSNVRVLVSLPSSTGLYEFLGQNVDNNLDKTTVYHGANMSGELKLSF